MKETKEKKDFKQEEIEQFVENYNSQIAGAPLSFILYRELAGIFWYLTQNKRFRDIFTTLLDNIAQKDISSFVELISYFDKATVESVFDEGMIEDLFKIKVINREEN